MCSSALVSALWTAKLRPRTQQKKKKKKKKSQRKKKNRLWCVARRHTYSCRKSSIWCYYFDCLGLAKLCECESVSVCSGAAAKLCAGRHQSKKKKAKQKKKKNVLSLLCCLSPFFAAPVFVFLVYLLYLIMSPLCSHRNALSRPLPLAPIAPARRPN